MHEKENIIRILKETTIALKREDSFKLKKLSEQTNHTAAIYQDPDNILVAVLVYALGKIIERDNYKKMDGWGIYMKSIIKNLDLAIKALQKEDIEEFRTLFGQIRNAINEIEGNLKDYINDIFYKAGINKAFKFYEHGLSSQRTAELLGISLWDLSSYIGQGTIAESKVSESMPVKKRIEMVEEFFR